MKHVVSTRTPAAHVSGKMAACPLCHLQSIPVYPDRETGTFYDTFQSYLLGFIGVRCSDRAHMAWS